jgi:deazaflavin-dependent oxidoreductase (nitroreductase family)
MASDLQWAIFNRLTDVHTGVYKLTGGRLGQKIPRGKGRMLLLEHVGAKSGKHRTIPLLYIDDGDDVVIVASKGGSHKHPAWFHNLMANPATRVQIGSEKRDVVAHKAGRREKKRLWPQVVEKWPDYENYQERTEREIPLVILSPRT